MKLLVFGFGYSAQYIAERLRGTGAEITHSGKGGAADAERHPGEGFSPDHRESELRAALRYPSYREGVTALRADGEGPVGR